MIDTVVMTLPVAMHRPREMLDLQFSRTCSHDGRDCQHPARWKLNPPKVAATLPRLTWNTAPNGNDYLSAIVSIPKLLFESNVEMVENQRDINIALTAISRYVSETANTDFEASAANVMRVDYCHNWKLTPVEVCEYLRVLGNASVSRMTRHVIDTNTVQFSNASKAVVFYDKLQEVISRLRVGKASNREITASVGVLRFEKRFLNYRACERLASTLGLPNRRAESLLSIDVAEFVMNETIKELGLDKSLESGDVRLDRLIEAYGPKRASGLAGFLAFCDSYGADNLIRLGLYKRSTFHRMRRQIKLAGAWLVTDRRRILSPLRLVQPTQQVRAA
jgi:hypothetical protein